jgi:hypothetical protein
MKKFFITLLGIVFTVVASAQSDFDIAQEFMSKKGVTLSKENKASTRGEDKPYSIFNAEDGKGFAIVANGIVVGYSTENTCDGYPFPSVACSRGFKLNPKTPIDYMIKCTWSFNGEPFYNQTPLMVNDKGEKVHAHNGCAATALAQVMYYYRNKGCKALSKYVFPEGLDFPSLEALPATTFNWNLILPKYAFTEYTVEQGEEVAKLMKYVGYAVKTQYSYKGSGAWLDPQYLTSLGFSNQSYWTRDNPGMGQLSDKKLEEIFDKELEKGRPVIMAGYYINGGGHFFIIDGRDDTGRYHVNQGSNGFSDGYYIISQELYLSGQSVDGLLNRLDRVFCVVPIMPKGWVIPSTTDIESVKEDKVNNGMVYNLQGQKVGYSLEGLSKGIYIKDGKKHIVR